MMSASRKMVVLICGVSVVYAFDLSALYFIWFDEIIIYLAMKKSESVSDYHKNETGHFATWVT